MTRDQALAEAERKQSSDPESTWLATQSGDEWTVARIDGAPNTVRPTGTATKPPPTEPFEGPQAPIEQAGNLWG